MFRKMVLPAGWILLLTLSFLFTISGQGVVQNTYPIYANSDQPINVLTYNIRGARSAEKQLLLNRIVEDIRMSGADIVALQEVDVHLPRSHFQNQPSLLADALSMNYVFAPNLNFIVGSYGNAILSKFPIVGYNHYVLPSLGETRGVLKANINLGYETIDVYSTHLGLNLEERKRQISYIRELVSDNHQPYILLLGDFNDMPTNENMPLLRSALIDPVYENKLNLSTYQFYTKPIQLDYIFFSPGFTFERAAVFPSSSSDHNPMMYSVKVESRQVLEASQ